MKRNLIRVVVLIVGMMLMAVGVASAHEGRDVGDYHIAFGWRNEPAYAGQFNGPEIFISSARATPEPGEDEAPADDSIASLDVNLQAEVTFGDQTTTVTFKPAWGEVGHYIADLIPTLPGDYSFHVTGNIGETAVDETFTSADGKFGTVELTSDITFPSAQSLDARVADLEARVSELEAAIAALSQ